MSRLYWCLMALGCVWVCLSLPTLALAAQDAAPAGPDAAPVLAPDPVSAPTPASPAEPAPEPDEPPPILPIDPPVQLGSDAGFAGAPDLRLILPYTAGLRVGPGVLHPYAGLRFEYRSNVFYKTARIDHDTLEALDVGLHWATPGAETGTAASQVVADYQARFELFNRFSELNYISQHAQFSAQMQNADFGAGVSDSLGTAHDPDTVELAALVNREIRRFFHHLELHAFEAQSADATMGRFGVAATADHARYEGTALNAAETDAYGVNLSYSQAQGGLPVLSDPLIFKFSIRGSDHPRPVLNNLVMYQAVVKAGGALGGAEGPNGNPWDCELVLGLAAIDVQTFRALNTEKREDVLAPVAAFQMEGTLNSRQVLRLRLTALHEPDLSITSNYQRRTRLAARMTQHLNETYEWEVQGAQEWADPSRGPTLSQFTFHGEVRWYREFPNRFLGRHAPVFFRVETRNLGTAQRNTSGVKTWNETRLTLGWGLAL